MPDFDSTKETGRDLGGGRAGTCTDATVMLREEVDSDVQGCEVEAALGAWIWGRRGETRSNLAVNCIWDAKWGSPSHGGWDAKRTNPALLLGWSRMRQWAGRGSVWVAAYNARRGVSTAATATPQPRPPPHGSDNRSSPIGVLLAVIRAYSSGGKAEVVVLLPGTWKKATTMGKQ